VLQNISLQSMYLITNILFFLNMFVGDRERRDSQSWDRILETIFVTIIDGSIEWQA
jgi:hypothetical protein